MPLAKRRPNLSQLIAIGARNRDIFLKLRQSVERKRSNRVYVSTRRSYGRTTSTLNFEFVNDNDSESHEDGINRTDSQRLISHHFLQSFPPTLIAIFLKLSHRTEKLLIKPWMQLLYISAILLSSLSLGYDASEGINSSWNNAFNITDKIVNIFFVIQGFLKLIALYEYASIELEVCRKSKISFSRAVAIIRYSGVIDVILGSLCIVYEHSDVSGVVRLLRLFIVFVFALEYVPQLDVLLSGIMNGIKSLLLALILIVAVFMVYGVFGVYCFQYSDPFHFGTLTTSIWTFFEIFTLDNWTNVLYVNTDGCDFYPTEYTSNTDGYTSNPSFYASGSQLYYPICVHPQLHPVAATLVIMSFVIIAGFVLLNLAFAAVVTGINDKLQELERKEILAEVEDQKILEQIELQAKPQDNIEDQCENGEITNEKNPNTALLIDPKKFRSLFMNQAQAKKKQLMANPELLSNKLASLWRNPLSNKKVIPSEMLGGPREEGNDNNQPIPESMTQTHMIATLMKTLTYDRRYSIMIDSVILIATSTQIYELQYPSDHYPVFLTLLLLNICYQIIFTLDIVFRILSVEPLCSFDFWKDGWNRFDALIALLLWIPIIMTRVKHQNSFLALFRVLRILRISKILSKFEEYQLILYSISTSSKAIFYILLLLGALFYHFAVAGVFLFKENDPFHFGSLKSSFETLFQLITLDNWQVVARTNIFGCDVVGYSTGLPSFDTLCTTPVASGWTAAWYFILFFFLANSILLNLLVGVIITAMDLLSASSKETFDIRHRAENVRRKYHVDGVVVQKMLEIFELTDVNSNGRLTMYELQEVFKILRIKREEQFVLFMNVDKNCTGKIDFAEFCEVLCITHTESLDRIKKGKPITTAFKIHNWMLRAKMAIMKKKLKINTVLPVDLPGVPESLPPPLSEKGDMEIRNVIQDVLHDILVTVKKKSIIESLLNDMVLEVEEQQHYQLSQQQPPLQPKSDSTMIDITTSQTEIRNLLNNIINKLELQGVEVEVDDEKIIAIETSSILHSIINSIEDQNNIEEKGRTAEEVNNVLYNIINNIEEQLKVAEEEAEDIKDVLYNIVNKIEVREEAVSVSEINNMLYDVITSIEEQGAAEVNVGVSSVINNIIIKIETQEEIEEENMRKILCNGILDEWVESVENKWCQEVEVTLTAIITTLLQTKQREEEEEEEVRGVILETLTSMINCIDMQEYDYRTPPPVTTTTMSTELPDNNNDMFIATECNALLQELIHSIETKIDNAAMIQTKELEVVVVVVEEVDVIVVPTVISELLNDVIENLTKNNDTTATISNNIMDPELLVPRLDTTNTINTPPMTTSTTTTSDHLPDMAGITMATNSEDTPPNNHHDNNNYNNLPPPQNENNQSTALNASAAVNNNNDNDTISNIDRDYSNQVEGIIPENSLTNNSGIKSKRVSTSDIIPITYSLAAQDKSPENYRSDTPSTDLCSTGIIPAITLPGNRLDHLEDEEHSHLLLSLTAPLPLPSTNIIPPSPDPDRDIRSKSRRKRQRQPKDNRGDSAVKDPFYDAYADVSLWNRPQSAAITDIHSLIYTDNNDSARPSYTSSRSKRYLPRKQRGMENSPIERFLHRGDRREDSQATGVTSRQELYRTKGTADNINAATTAIVEDRSQQSSIDFLADNNQTDLDAIASSTAGGLPILHRGSYLDQHRLVYNNNNNNSIKEEEENNSTSIFRGRKTNKKSWYHLNNNQTPSSPIENFLHL